MATTKTTTTTKQVSRPAKQAQQIVKKTVVTSAQPNQKKKGKGKNGNKGPKARLSLKQAFKRHLEYPDLYGTFRIPREGGAVRTVLCYDRTRFTLSAANTSIVGLQMQTTYNASIVGFTAVNQGASLTPTSYNPSSQFPPLANLADVNFVAGSMTVQATTNWSNVAGELIIGRSIPILSASTYSTMLYYPGTVAVQGTQILEHPMRSSAQKISPVANEFVSTTLGNSDVELPFVFLNPGGVATTQNYVVEVTRVFEARTTTAAGNVIGYDNEDRSFTSDLNAYQDAVAENGMSLFGTISSYIPSAIGAAGASAAAKWALDRGANYFMHRLQNGQHGGGIYRGNDLGVLEQSIGVGIIESQAPHYPRSSL